MNTRIRMKIRVYSRRLRMTKAQKQRALYEQKHLQWWMKKTGAYEW